MTKLWLNQARRFKTPTSRFAAGLCLFIALASLLALTAVPVAAENPPGNSQGSQVYLPLVLKSGSNATPASNFAQTFLTTLERCYNATGLNQVCYGNGQVQANGLVLAQPGDVADLANGQSLTLTSPNDENWSVALLRLRTDSTTPDQSLTLLAFGNVQISNLALYAEVGNDEAILPGLQFASSPVAGAPGGVSGLLLFNPAADEYQSITLNGAAVALETSAFSQAEPGNAMSVTMVNGSVLTVEAGNGSSAVIPGHQTSVPLGPDGLAAGAPGAATALAGDALAPLRLTTQTARLSTAAAAHPMIDVMLKAIPEYFTDSKVHAFYNDLAGIYETNINKVYNRCVTEPTDARGVYGLMVLNKMLRSNPNLDPAFGSQRFAQLAAKMRKCATFELEFDSQIHVMRPELSYTSHVNSQGFQLWFDLNGELFFENDQVVPIKHLNYEVIGADVPGCAMHTILEDGQMLLVDYGFATLRGSKLKIHLEVWPEMPFEEIYYTCPGSPPTESMPLPWSPIFYLFHRDKLRSTPPEAYIFKDWKYNGRKNFAEAIYTGLAADFDGASATSDSYLILVHTPQK